MSLSDRQRKLFFVAVRKLGLAEVEWRAAMAELAGTESLTELDQDGFDVMLAYFEWRGFQPLQHGKDYGQRPGMASFAQLELIRALWREATRNAYGREEAQLDKWLLRSFKVSSLRFLTADAARKAITALKMMKARAAG